MPFITESQVRRLAANATLSKSVRADSILKEEAAVKQAAYDIFLSHSYGDKEMILGIKRFVESKGFSVYVDWVDDKQLDRSKVTKETASVLREQMNRCKCLIYAYSPNISQSRWCPWELGYFDGKNGKSYVMPVVAIESDGYAGVEYVGLYPKIVEEQARDGTMNLYVRLPKEYVYLPAAIG
jgi:hypothetical protein